MGLIYHYTRFETFMSYIWPSGTIRTNSLRYMNDPRESLTWSFANFKFVLFQLFGEGLVQLFPEVVTVKESKGLLSSAKEVWECSCGHGNKLETTVCSSCSKDKRGFGSEEVKPDSVQKRINRRLQVIEGV